MNRVLLFIARCSYFILYFIASRS